MAQGKPQAGSLFWRLGIDAFMPNWPGEYGEARPACRTSAVPCCVALTDLADLADLAERRCAGWLLAQQPLTGVPGPPGRRAAGALHVQADLKARPAREGAHAWRGATRPVRPRLLDPRLQLGGPVAQASCTLCRPRDGVLPALANRLRSAASNLRREADARQTSLHLHSACTPLVPPCRSCRCEHRPSVCADRRARAQYQKPPAGGAVGQLQPAGPPVFATQAQCCLPGLGGFHKGCSATWF